MFGGNTSGQLGRGFKPAATKPETVKGELFDIKTVNKDFNYYNVLYNSLTAWSVKLKKQQKSQTVTWYIYLLNYHT